MKYYFVLKKAKDTCARPGNKSALSYACPVFLMGPGDTAAQGGARSVGRRQKEARRLVKCLPPTVFSRYLTLLLNDTDSSLSSLRRT